MPVMASSCRPVESKVTAPITQSVSREKLFSSSATIIISQSVIEYETVSFLISCGAMLQV